MSNIKFCSIIIKDDFNNILISKRKGKKADEHLWYIFERKIKGRETPEKCANRAIKEDLKTIVFDLNKLCDLNDYTFANGELEKINAFFDTI